MKRQSYFYCENARPISTAFGVIGVIGIIGTFYFATALFPKVVGGILFGSFSLFALFGLVSGGRWSCTFIGNTLHWECPNRFFGPDGTSEVSDIVEFHRVISCGAHEHGGLDSFHFLTISGDELHIEQQCFGNVDKFLNTLRELNPDIVFKEYYKHGSTEHAGGTLRR